MNIEEIIDYEDQLVTYLEEGKEKDFQENIIRNGILIGKNKLDRDYPELSHEHNEQLKQIYKRFTIECKKLCQIENIPMMRFLLKHFSFSDHTLQMIINDSIEKRTVNWIEKICIPLCKNQSHYSTYLRIDIKGVFERKDASILDLLKKHQIREADHIRIINVKNIEELDFIFNYTYRKREKSPNHIEQLKNEYKNLFDILIKDLPRKDEFFWKAYHFFKNVEELRTGNYFNPEYVIVKLLCNNHDTYNTKESYLFNIINELYNEDKNFKNNLKYIIKSYPFIKEIKNKVEFKTKLENDMQKIDSKVLKKNKL